jgi:RNA polymerase sigma-70 factor (ECF subfamily)
MDPHTLKEATEEELIQKAVERNQDAFAELVRRNKSVSMRLALSVLKNRQEAEDEVQTSFLKAWLHLPGFQRESRFSTWLRTIVMNQSFMRLRSLRRAKLESLTAEDDENRPWELPSLEANPESQVGRDEMSRRLRTEVDRLPPIYREVIELRDLEELQVEDVAQQLGISIPALKSRLARARQMLRQRMERHQ